MSQVLLVADFRKEVLTSNTLLKALALICFKAILSSKTAEAKIQKKPLSGSELQALAWEQPCFTGIYIGVS